MSQPNGPTNPNSEENPNNHPLGLAMRLVALVHATPQSMNAEFRFDENEEKSIISSQKVKTNSITSIMSSSTC